MGVWGGVVPDNLTRRANSIGASANRARNVNRSELPAAQKEPVLLTHTIGENADNVAGGIDAVSDGLPGDPTWTASGRRCATRDINCVEVKRLGGTSVGEQQQPKSRCENESLRVSLHLSPPVTNPSTALRHEFEVVRNLLANVSGITKGCKGHVRPDTK